MNFLEQFYNKTIKYELINKFHYKKNSNLPKLDKIILNFGCKTAEMKQLASCLLALELVSNQRGIFTRTKHSNILFKIRKGNPTGCKVTLHNLAVFNFLSKTLIEVFPKLKNFNGFIVKKKSKNNVFSYELHETFSFPELKSHYYLFNNLPKLDVTIVTTSTKKDELIYLLKTFQLPFPSRKIVSKQI